MSSMSSRPSVGSFGLGRSVFDVAQHLMKLPENSDEQSDTANDSSNGTVTMINLTNNEATKHRPECLKGRTLYGIGCQQDQCHAAMMEKFNLQRTTSARSKDQVLDEATEFLREYYEDCHPSGVNGLRARLDEVTKSIRDVGYYFHTTDELKYGVQLCWRNSARCIMRIQWRNIRIIDARGSDAEYGHRIENEEIFEGCVKHLRNTVTRDNGGNHVINTTMTVFPQLLPGDECGCRIWNSQLIRFAGYRNSDGSILGDPVNVDLTDACLALGWESPGVRTPFDVLPLIVQASDNSPPSMYVIPEDAQLLVPIIHPKYPEFSDLKIKWHAIPALSCLTCDIGGIQYPCVPFNGWYLSTEIACRNLCDIQRYNLLPAMAKVMGLDISGDQRELVRDRALVEMNAAVLHSFAEERITIVDHYTASESFVRHYNKEIETRGFIPADWVWIVPPFGGSSNQVFHQEMVNFFIKPNFLSASHTPKQLLELCIRKGLVELCDDKQQGQRSLPAVRIKSKASYAPAVVGRWFSAMSTALQQTQKFYIYYGSETGVSEKYAKVIMRHINANGGRTCRVVHIGTLNGCDLNDFSTTNIKSGDESESIFVAIITSTFGSGGPPRNASDFYEQLHDRTYDEQNIDLSGIKVVIFGNGNSSYADFNKCASDIESRLRDLRATILLSGSADERSDPDGAFREWCNKLFAHTSCGKLTTAIAGNFSKQTPNLQMSRQSHFRGKFETVPTGTMIRRTNVVLASGREVFQYDLDPSEQVQIEDGDHVAILPRNSPEDVSNILMLMKLTAKKKQYVDVSVDAANGTVPGFLQGMYTLDDILLDHIDLSAPPPFVFVQKMSELALIDDKDRADLAEIASSYDKYRAWITEYAPSQVEFFQRFPSVAQRLPLSVFLTNVARIAPRMYSASSSNVVDKDIAITVRIDYINGKRDGRDVIRRGLCSDYLWRLEEGDQNVRMYVCPSHNFHLATDVPIVMIANGSGISPFRGFWRTLAATTSVGEVKADAALMFYGCRSRDEVLYGEEMAATFTDHNLAIAYSRDASSEVKYVTELVSRDAVRLAEYIGTRHAKVYVCGTKQMAEDTRARIKDIVGVTEFEELVKVRQYVEEVY